MDNGVLESTGIEVSDGHHADSTNSVLADINIQLLKVEKEKLEKKCNGMNYSLTHVDRNRN